MEAIFLEHSYRWLKAGGALIFVIPQLRLAKCARLLSEHFTDLRVFRLTEPACLEYKQIVVLATRRKRHSKVSDAVFLDGVRHLEALATKSELEPLGDNAEVQYEVPASEPVVLTHVGIPLDEIEDLLLESAAYRQAGRVLLPKLNDVKGRPLTPLHGGHVGLICTAGMLNGVFGEGETRHIAHWRSVKFTDHWEEQEEDGTLRFGWLTYVKSTEKTTTSIKLRLDRFIGEVLPDPPQQAKAHLISVIGGDTQIAAICAAISLGERFMVEGPEVKPIRVCFERTPQCFKGSLQLSGRKKPLRHLIALSEEFASSSVSASSGRTLLASSESRFIWASLAHIHGIPGIPDWADWFAGELDTHKAIIRALGIGCAPVLVKGEKEQFLSWLSWGVKSEAIKFPEETGSIHWPSLGLKDILFHTNTFQAQ